MVTVDGRERPVNTWGSGHSGAKPGRYGIIWPNDVDRNDPPADGQIFDLLEFSYEFIAEAKEPQYHSYMSHSHYSYDQESGRARFLERR
ncbi:MAG TPA: hypothetical protein VGJ29_00195 [Vicinamibacterales bacterium]|jgi:hypothetical protein